MGKRIAKKVLLIGWDAADWKVIHPLMDAGKMPAMESLVNQGTIGNLATMDPPLSPMLWSSIATGKYADKHRVLGFSEPTPDGKDIRPVMSTSRKVKAVWNMLTQKGYKTHVIGWWPSHPAEPINGISISNFYQRANDGIDKPWEMLEGTVHPKEMEEIFKDLRIHPDELTEAHMLPFIPNAAKVNQMKDKRMAAASRIIADCATIHSACTYIMENEEWDFLAVYHDAIDHFCHGFMKFHPPRLPGIKEEDFELYKDVVTSGYMFHDMMLERLINLAGPETTIILNSDHGFHSDHLRPLALPREPAGPAYEHSPYGVIVLKGPGVKKDETIHGASVLDITPTILSLFGEPLGEDMDGHALVQAFEDPMVPDTIPSWEDLEGESGMHPPETVSDQLNDEVLQQLVDLGYIEKPSPDRVKAVDAATIEMNYHLARVYIYSQRPLEAIPLLEEIMEKRPDENRFILKAINCYQAVGRLKDAHEWIDHLNAKKNVNLPGLKFLEGNLLLSEGKPKLAIAKFEEAEKGAPSMINLHNQIGKAYNSLKKWPHARKAFNSALEMDPDNPMAHHGLGVTYLREGKYEEAIDELLNAVGLLYHFPTAHYHLGEALIHLEQWEHAANAFEVSLRMAPNLGKSRQQLLKLYEGPLKNEEKVAHHKSMLDQMQGGTIYIVSGLPRSGTSMMMQMLHNGGLEVFTDKERNADESNPKGYFEHEAVKTLQRNKKWLPSAKDKVVKIISHLLMYLPPKYHYKVIFMERNISEVVQSQQIMLDKMNKAKNDPEDYNISLDMKFRASLDKCYKWADNQENVEILKMDYSSVINDPGAAAHQINEFLDLELDEEAMKSSVDPQLHRTKVKPKKV